MSELKAYTYDDMLDGAADVDVEFYQKSEVDAAIAELNAKLAEKESDYKSALKAVSHWHDNYCELQKVVDRLQTKSECKEDKIRILKRALWIARGLFCGRSSEYFSGMASRCKIGQVDLYREVSERARRYMKSYCKYRAKAEEFK